MTTTSIAHQKSSASGTASRVGSSDWFGFRFFCHPDGPDGLPAKWCWIIAARKGWSIQWHKHTKACRYGLYTNLRTHGGLVAALNLPLLGDFSLWR